MIACLAAVVSTLPAGAAPVINEFLASNVSVYPDNRDFDDYSDWIELHNPSATNVSLDNHFLTDDLTRPFKWLIPSGAEIPAGGYLMVRADGFDAGPGETRTRGYFPWGSTFVTERYHASFKLSAGGEAVGLYRSDSPAIETTLIATNASWAYLDTGGNPGADWPLLGYDDSAWSVGMAELGYGDDDEATEVAFGPDSESKYATTHFRHVFTVIDPDRLGNLRFRVLVDDGAIIYLNGEEFERIRMPAGEVSYLDYTGLSGADYAFDTVELLPEHLQAGTNILAIEVHQATEDSSDLSLNVELLATEITGTPIHIDSVTYAAQTADVSYGRTSTATNSWAFFGEPTPGATNDTEALVVQAAAPSVEASVESGFYDVAQAVSLTAPGADAIRYTLDGSIPDSSSLLYTNPLFFTNTTILRARGYAAGYVPSPVLTRSYFMGMDATNALPVYSLVAEPDTLFGDEIGIYENDTPYVFKGREVPVRLEFFESDQRLGYAVSAGTRIAGENIWTKAQKPFNIYCRSKYGDDAINYQVFPGESVGTFGELNLRNGGDDWEDTLLRDAMMPVILEGQTDSNLYSYRPSVLYVNGTFWGIYNTRKRFDDTFFAQEHYLTEGDYDQLAYAHDGSESTILLAESGSIKRYEAFKTFFTTNNVSDPAIYAQMLEQMDVDSFIDYIVATDYAVNTSWYHNREFWKPRADGEKWKWIINDFDRGFDPAKLNLSPGSSLYSSAPISSMRAHYTLLQAMDNNTNFVNRLVQRYAAHVGSTFDPDRVSQLVDQLAAEQDADMPRHVDRWSASGGIASMTARQNALNDIKHFATNRPAFALSRLNIELGLGRTMWELSVSASPASGGNILVAGVPMAPEYATNLTLFADTPVELEAQAAPGFQFVDWSNGDTNAVIEITLSAAQALTANFVSGAETVLAGTLSADTTLSAANAPYVVVGDLIVPAGTTLTIEAGVEMRFPAKSGVRVYGALVANGTESEPIVIAGRGGQRWGNLGFVDATGLSTLSHVVLRDATRSRHDPVNLYAAVSGYNASIVLDHVDIEAAFPVFTRFGSTTLRDCRMHILFTGDGVNIKSGVGAVTGCEFIGNESPDTDAIDFDDVVDGLIANNRVYAFRGFNSDAIDAGEGCVNLLIASNRVFNCTDKGVSVGQASEVRVYRNLIVDCDMGVAVKDFGSSAVIEQNTFARNNIDVAAFEKNVGNGGGSAIVSSSIFHRTKTQPILVDALSSVTVSYSLSDTLPLVGVENANEDPRFTDPGAYDFSLAVDSPAIDTGDPALPVDADTSRADQGAYYVFDADDYPYLIPNIVVINEVLAHSHDIDPDWIELHNTSTIDLDMGGWFLSDDPDEPEKFRVAEGTILPGGGYLVFYEDLHFGAASTNAGALVPFALSENGDTVNVFGPSDGLRPEYEEKETFGGSLRNVTKGRYFKESTRTYNFVTMAFTTPGAANSDPRVGPIVISEIMYNPIDSAAEYMELVNISESPVTLYDADFAEPWKMTQGVEYSFPAAPPLTLQTGERVLLVRDMTTFTNAYAPPAGIPIFQWSGGALNNGGETIELSLPGDTNQVGELQFIRVDRVDYSDDAPWPTSPDGGGDSLTRIDERTYGNDVANWTATIPTTGQTGFEHWAAEHAFPAGEAGWDDDPDGDGLANKVEYALGLDPLYPSERAEWEMALDALGVRIAFDVAPPPADVDYVIQSTTNLTTESWTDMEAYGGERGYEALDATTSDHRYYRLLIILRNQYEHSASE